MPSSFQQQKTTWRRKLFALQSDPTALALDVFRYQAQHNPIYARYLQTLHCTPSHIDQLCDIPCLPIGLYRTQHIQTGAWTPQCCFQSSGTSSDQPSLHFIDEVSFYEEVATHIFEQRYGSLQGMLILALLPDYLERPNSSLIHMLQAFMGRSSHPGCGFFKDQWSDLAARITTFAAATCRKQLWGLPLSLLAFAKAHTPSLQTFTVIETGGTKRHYSSSRTELQQELKEQLHPQALHSEYGMTELLSQGYATDNLIFSPPPWMRFFTRDPEDPLSSLPTGTPGALNIIDLANMHSCAFLATDDLGRVNKNGSFELHGRLPAAAPRGCHLLYEV